MNTAKEMTHQQSLPTIEPAKAATPMDLLQAAVSSGVDADQLGKLMDLQERWEANQARKAFFEGMAQMQSELPIIYKNKQGDKSAYAPLEQIVEKIRPILDRNGFSVRFDVEPTMTENGNIAIVTAKCYVSHRMGHTEVNSFAVPVDIGPMNKQGKQVMNGAQATASARSYAKRYALGDGLNLVFGDEDNDGAGLGADCVTDQQIVELKDYIESLGDSWTGEDEAKWFEYLKVNQIEEIKADRFKAALMALKRKAVKS